MCWILIDLQDYKCNTICTGSSDPFYIVTYYIKLATTSLTHSTTFDLPISTRELNEQIKSWMLKNVLENCFYESLMLVATPTLN